LILTDELSLSLPIEYMALDGYAWPATRVLVADDDDDIRDLVAMTLRMAGYAVATTNDGPSVLAAIDRRCPDVAVLDVVMPGISGFEICRRLRDRPGTSTLPVILLSAKAGPEAICTGLDAGATSYLTKPIDFQRLLNDVRSIQ
jgi:DNA-binding response OmpR family regulator